MSDARALWKCGPRATSRDEETCCVRARLHRKVIFSREGLPNAVVTDNEPQFVLVEMEEYFQKNGIKHKKCSLYHPRGMGQ
ncbi:hypothetical protein NDU88_007488 [Pleurodeles waltl]|uniref:Integrase catalytic domain-containing protein n=1 Tax=Pleurodeles waltl TaxID=8319 RepID=A0AAV7RV26_PLEWA|nr:hypothetical protein NDU88_007488 [Pleurodeles waltl]